jgi:hypothetical protein
MPSELDSLVIANLREIHAELRGINAKLDDHNRRFDRIERQLDGRRPLIEHTLSVATLNQLKAGKLEAHRDATAAWQKRMDERLDEIDRRLAKAEEKMGS